MVSPVTSVVNTQRVERNYSINEKKLNHNKNNESVDAVKSDLTQISAETLEAIQNYLVSQPTFLANEDELFDPLYMSGISIHEAYEEYLSGELTEKQKGSVILRFAINFLSSDKSNIKDDKIEILQNDKEFQGIVRTVLSSAVADDPDGDKIMKVFEEAMGETIEKTTKSPPSEHIDHLVKQNKNTKNKYNNLEKQFFDVTTSLEEAETEFNKRNNQNLSPEKKAKLLAEILERIEEFKKLGNKFELGMKEFEKIVLEALSLNIFSDDEKEGLKELMQVLDIYGVSVVVFGIELMGAIKNIDLEKGELELDENNDYFIMAKNWLTTQKGLEEDDAINKIYEFMFYSMLAKDLYEKSIKMKEINSQMEFLMHSIDQKIQLIEMRIEILRLKESEQEPDNYSEEIENNLISILRSLDNMVSEREQLQTSAMAFSAEKEAINKMILELNLDETFKEQLTKVLEEINLLAENTNYNFNVQLVVEQLRI